MSDITPYHELAASIGYGKSKLMPKMFRMIVDKEEAKVLLAASPPATVEELAEKTGIAAERLPDMLDELFMKGLIFKSKKPDAIRYYKFRWYVQFHDATVLTPGIPEAYLKLWQEFEKTEMPFFESQKDPNRKPGMRVVPVNATIETGKQVAVFDDVVDMVKKADIIAATACSCRTIHQIDTVPLEVCMQMNKAATYALERGTGRELTVEEAIEMLKMCEQEGLVHCVDNRMGLGNIICNCDNVGCGNWGRDRKYTQMITAPSRFRAVIAPDDCTACETCIERCFFDAIEISDETNAAWIDATKCMGCGICMTTCPDESIHLEEIRSPDFIPN